MDPWSLGTCKQVKSRHAWWSGSTFFMLKIGNRNEKRTGKSVSSEGGR